MTRSETVFIPQNKIVEAKKVRDELDSLIETAEILNNHRLLESIRKSEQDLRSGKTIRIRSKKELNDFFKR